jgi:uncharacterized protein YegP (UPF0339 family)
MAGKSELYKDKAGEFRFRLKAGNGQIILTGEGYKSKDGLLNGVESVRKDAVQGAGVPEDKLPALSDAIGSQLGGADGLDFGDLLGGLRVRRNISDRAQPGIR